MEEKKCDMVTIFKDGEPCSYPGCKNHVSHPCEGCGRSGAIGPVELPRVIVEGWGWRNKTQTYGN